MIPYVPEGPPPLDEEDSGSPMDTPVGFLTILQSLGVPSEHSPAPSAIPAPPQLAAPPTQQDDNFFDDFQSARVDSLTSTDPAPPSSAAKYSEEIPTMANACPSHDENLVNGFPSASQAKDVDEEFGDFGDFSSAPVEVELRKSVVEDDESERDAKKEDGTDTDEAFDDDVLQADSTESDAVVANSDEPESENESGRGAPLENSRNAESNVELDEELSVAKGDEISKSDAEVVEFKAFQDGDDDDFGDFRDGEVKTETLNASSTVKIKAEDEFKTLQEAASTREKKEAESCNMFHEAKEECNDDFGNFRDGEETDDFGDFKTQPLELRASEENEVEAEEDDFGGFQSLRECGDENADFGDFADFAQADNAFDAFAPPPETPSSEADHDGFGNFAQSDGWASEEKFEAAAPVDTSAVAFVLEKDFSNDKEPRSLLERILANMEKVLSSCYASADDLPEDAAPLGELGSESDAKLSGGDPTADPKADDAALWSLLIDFDKAFALQYQLGKSLGNECFLKALNIDSRNVLKNSRKPVLPVFASQLGLLEPTRGAAPEAGSGTSPGAAIPAAEATLPGVAVGSGVAAGAIGADGEPCIPASEFDWTSSGLTNPLDSTNSNFYLDLDFFEASQLNHSAGMAPIKSELEEQFLCKELIAPPGAGLEVKLDPVQSILTRVRGSSGAATKVETELSTQARAYLDRLANLDYMKARVLMFPIGHS